MKNIVKVVAVLLLAATNQNVQAAQKSIFAVAAQAAKVALRGHVSPEIVTARAALKQCPMKYRVLTRVIPANYTNVKCETERKLTREVNRLRRKEKGFSKYTTGEYSGLHIAGKEDLKKEAEVFKSKAAKAQAKADRSLAEATQLQKTQMAQIAYDAAMTDDGVGFIHAIQAFNKL